VSKLRVVGAGLGRTGTHSLKLALEELLGAPCHHMVEVFQHPEQVAYFRAAMEGKTPDWDELFAGYAATVDWPSCAFWPELAEHYPDAIVLLSTRRDAEAWYKSAIETIFATAGDPGAEQQNPVIAMAAAVSRHRFCDDVTDKAKAIAAYERHNAAVRAAVPKERLVDWQPDQGFSPICAALGLPVPGTPFPHVNTTEEFQAHARARRAERP
jgi:sulfotransferase family protein